MLPELIEPTCGGNYSHHRRVLRLAWDAIRPAQWIHVLSLRLHDVDAVLAEVEKRKCKDGERLSRRTVPVCGG